MTNAEQVTTRPLLIEDVYHVGTIKQLIDPEAQKEYMLPRSIEDITRIIYEKRGVGCIVDGLLVGFCFYLSWTEELVEVGGLVVDLAFRRNGLAKDLVEKTTLLARSAYPAATICSLTHPDGSTQAFQAAGYERTSLESINGALAQCRECPCLCWKEGSQFKGCSLVPLVYQARRPL